MRLWSVHPKYLDTKGIVALWREGLLAKKVLEGGTKGYTRHPQLFRFQQYADPILAINAYLCVVYREAERRGYRFADQKIRQCTLPELISVTEGQMRYEREHLLAKLKEREPEKFKQLWGEKTFEPHPCFVVIAGPVEEWEKVDEAKDV